MGLASAFIFSLNRRGLLAVLAISISVGYALVAGGAVEGLKDAQGALAGQLSEPERIVAKAGLDPFTLEAGGGADGYTQAHALHVVDGRTFYTVRHGDPGTTNLSRGLAGPAAELPRNGTVLAANITLLVERGRPPPGAQSSWIQVPEATFLALGGPQPPTVHVAALQDGADPPRGAGLSTYSSPAAFPFYERGAQQVVSTVSVTVVASALVVALLTSTFVAMEIRARRQSLATLQLYAGSRIVQGLVGARAVFLLVAGHALAVGGALGLFLILDRVGDVSLALAPGFMGPALTATLGGGLLGAAIPALRASGRLDTRRLGQEAPPAWAPRALRPTLTSWRTLLPLAVSAMVLAGSLGVIFGTVDMPDQIFGTEGSQVIADTGNNPLRGTVDAFEGLHLATSEAYEAASPEIFAPTTLDGRPLMVRGVSWSHLTSLDRVVLIRGEAPAEPGQAVAGDRLADRAGLAVGDEIMLPGAYTTSVTPVTIVGIANAPGLLADELLVPLETARDLTGISSQSVNLIRFRAAPDPTTPFQAPQERHESGIEVTNLRVEPEEPLAYEQAVALVDAVNLEDANGTRHLTLSVDDQPVSDVWVTLGPQGTTTVELPFRVPAQGLSRLEVNPEATLSPGDAAYRIQTPRAVVVNATVTLTVIDRQGQAASDVTLSLDGTESVTGADGTAQLQPPTIGNRTVQAQGPAGRGATWLQVVEPSLLHRGQLVVRGVSGPEAATGEAWQGAVRVENVGGEVFDGNVTVRVDDAPVDTGTRVRVVPGGIARALVSVPLEPGLHRIGPPGAVIEVQGPPQAPSSDGGTGGGDQGSDGGTGGDDDDGADPGGQDGDQGPEGPSVEELLERRRQKARSQGGQEETDALSAFLGDTVDNLGSALTVVTLATVLHAGLIVLVAVQRDVEERAATVGTLSAMGADRRDLRRLAMREFGTAGLLSGLLGTALGLLAVWWAADAGLLTGFGHALIPRSSLGFGLRVAGVATIVTLGAAVLAVERVRSQHVTALLAEGPARARRPPIDRLLGQVGPEEGS